MITKLSIKLLQIIMYPQLKWYTKMCFCGNRTLVQMLLSDKFQKGCRVHVSGVNITLYLSAKKHFHIKYERKFYKTIAKEDDICSYDHRPTD